MTPASVQLQTRDNGEGVIALAGDWTLASLRSSVADVWKTLKSFAVDPNLTWDLRRVGTPDSTGALLIWRAWGAPAYRCTAQARARADPSAHCRGPGRGLAGNHRYVLSAGLP
jgi:hypothetical protein